MDIKLIGPDGRSHSLTQGPLELSYDPARDLFGAIEAGHDELAEDPFADALYSGQLRYLIGPADVIVGFQVLGFSIYEPEQGNLDLIYTPRFRAPRLRDADMSAAEIMDEARARFIQ